MSAHPHELKTRSMSDFTRQTGRSKILCVDDEPPILNIFEQSLNEEYHVLTALNGRDGLELLRANPDIIVILSDQKMPGMTGTEFFEQSLAINPDTIRIMVTAYSEVELIMDSINKGNVYKYILKPFEVDELRITLMRAVEHYCHRKAFEKAYHELKAAQEQLVKSERMSILGRLMSNVSHELGTPISNINHAAMLAAMEWGPIKSLIERLEQAHTTNDLKLLRNWMAENNIPQTVTEFEAIIQTIHHSSNYAKEIIQDLRGIARMDDSEWIKLDIHAIIERAIKLMQTKYKYNIEFHKQFSKLPPVTGLPGPLTQVFLNLIQNAAQAIPEKGDIWIRTREIGENVEIAIRDNGQGIPAALLPRIFEYGFTTKKEGEGSGLGLTITTGIIDKHGGRLDVTSTEGSGSEFTVTLPVDRPITMLQNEL